jgi:hypothetical protein
MPDTSEPAPHQQIRKSVKATKHAEHIAEQKRLRKQRELDERGCVTNLRCPYQGKSCFTDQAGAELVLRAAQNYTNYQKLTRTYRCHHCGNWHLTSAPDRSQSKKAA